MALTILVIFLYLLQRKKQLSAKRAICSSANKMHNNYICPTQWQFIKFYVCHTAWFLLIIQILMVILPKCLVTTAFPMMTSKFITTIVVRNMSLALFKQFVSFVRKWREGKHAWGPIVSWRMFANETQATYWQLIRLVVYKTHHPSGNGVGVY